MKVHMCCIMGEDCEVSIVIGRTEEGLLNKLREEVHSHNASNLQEWEKAQNEMFENYPPVSFSRDYI